MGTSRVCKYRIEWDSSYSATPHGINRQVNLDTYIRQMIDSFKIGGVNQHISLCLGFIPVPKSARLVRQRDGKVIQTWEHPPFMAI